MKRRSPLCPLLFAVFTLVLEVHPCRAQTAAAEIADRLFIEGRELMALGNYGVACMRFEEAQRLRKGVGTLLNLADCYERMGRIASAWTTFGRAALDAQAVQDPRERIARARARALEPRLGYLTVMVPEPEPGLEVFVNGTPFDSGVWGQARPLDPGEYVVEARSPRRPSWKARAVVASTETVVEIPPIAVAASPPVRVEDDNLKMSPLRWVAVGTGSIGVIGLVVGSVAGLDAWTKGQEVQDRCTHGPQGDCATESDRQLSVDAVRSGNIASIAFAVAGTALAAGVILWTISTEDSPAAEQVAVALKVQADRVGTQATLEAAW